MISVSDHKMARTYLQDKMLKIITEVFNERKFYNPPIQEVKPV